MKVNDSILNTILGILMIVGFFSLVLKCTQKDERVRLQELSTEKEVSIKKLEVKQDSIELEKQKLLNK